jgi:hypothetical protein
MSDFDAIYDFNTVGVNLYMFRIDCGRSMIDAVQPILNKALFDLDSGRICGYY